jgi:hypothetical protein
VTGFGVTEEDGEISDVLLDTQVFYLDPAICKSSYPDFVVNNEVMMCAGAEGTDRYVTLG